MCDCKLLSGFWSQVGFKISAVMTKISHTQTMVAKRGLTNWANVHFAAELEMQTHGSDVTSVETRNHGRVLANTNRNLFLMSNS